MHRPSLSQFPRVFSHADWVHPTALGVRQDPLVIFAPGRDTGTIARYDGRKTVRRLPTYMKTSNVKGCIIFFGKNFPNDSHQWFSSLEGVRDLPPNVHSFCSLSPCGDKLLGGPAPENSHATLLLALGRGLSWASWNPFQALWEAVKFGAVHKSWPKKWWFPTTKMILFGLLEGTSISGHTGRYHRRNPCIIPNKQSCCRKIPRAAISSQWRTTVLIIGLPEVASPLDQDQLWHCFSKASKTRLPA